MNTIFFVNGEKYSFSNGNGYAWTRTGPETHTRDKGHEVKKELFYLQINQNLNSRVCDTCYIDNTVLIQMSEMEGFFLLN